MRGNKARKWFGILLATALLVQLSYHTLHVFTSHIAHPHIEGTDNNTQIRDTAFTCELCAKLLGQTAYLWLLPIILPIVIHTFLVIHARTYSFEAVIEGPHSLRDPPVPL